MKHNVSVSVLLSIAGIISFIAIVVLTLIWLPFSVWSASAIFSLLVFAIAFAINIYFPGFLPPNRKKDDASEIASIMPNVITSGFLMIFSAATFFVSLYGYEKLSWSLNLVGLSACIIMIIYNSFFKGIISDLPVIDYSEKISKNWILNLKKITQKNSLIEKEIIERIIDKIEYGPSGYYPDDEEINEKISKYINKLDIDMESTSITKAQILEKLDELVALIDSREEFLRNLRAKTI
jgi:hypothetical protein